MRTAPRLYRRRADASAASQHHAKNPGIMAKLQKLVNAGIVRMG